MLSLRSLKRGIISSWFYFIFICLTNQAGFAHLSDVDRWNYNKAILQSRVSFYSKIISDFSNPSANEEELSELLALIIYKNPSPDDQEQIRLGLQQYKRSLGNPFFKDLILNVHTGIAELNYLPLVSILEKMTEGEKSFKSHFMKEKLTELDKIMSEQKSESHDEAGSQHFHISTLLEIHWEVENHIRKISSYQKHYDTESVFLSKKEKQGIELLPQTIEPGVDFLKELRRNLTHMIKEIDRDYAAVLTKFEDNLEFISFCYFMNEYKEELNKLVQNEARLRKNFYELQNMLNGKMSKEKPKNLQLKELLNSKPDKIQSTSNRDYFSGTTLSMVGEKLAFLKEPIRTKFEQLNRRIKQFFQNRNPTDELEFRKKLHIFFLAEIFKPTYVDGINKIREEKRFLKSASDFQRWLELEEESIQLSSFTHFVESRIISFFLKSKRLASELNKEADDLNEEIRNLKREVQNRGKILDREVVSSTHIQESQSTTQDSLELEPPKTGASASEGEANFQFQATAPTVVLDETEKVSQKTDEIVSLEHENFISGRGIESQMGIYKKIEETKSSARNGEFSQFQPDEAVKSLADAEIDSAISDIEVGATTFFTPIEDEYKAKIQQSITKKYREILEDIYSGKSAKFRFETLTNLVARCGGVLQFSGQGGSHFQITLPGGYTSYGWRPHGRAHSPKIQGRILNAFRDSLRGVADILGIEH